MDEKPTTGTQPPLDEQVDGRYQIHLTFIDEQGAASSLWATDYRDLSIPENRLALCEGIQKARSQHIQETPSEVPTTESLSSVPPARGGDDGGDPNNLGPVEPQSGP